MYSIPVIAIFAASYLAIRSFKKNGSGAKALKVNFIALVLVFSICAFGAVSAFAAEDDAATTAPVTTAAAEEAAEAGNGGAMAAGLGLLAAALATGLGGIGGGIAVPPQPRQLSARPAKTPRHSVKLLSSLLWVNPSPSTVLLSLS